MSRMRGGRAPSVAEVRAGPRRACPAGRARVPALSSIHGRHRSTILLAAGGGFEAGQPLAHDQRHGVLERRVGAVRDLVVFAAVIAVLQHGGEIAGHALHAPRADRLDARLLDGVEDRARLLPLGRQPAMDAASWQASAAPWNRHGRARWRRPARQLARRLGQRAPCRRQGRPVRREGDLELRLARDGAHGSRPPRA